MKNTKFRILKLYNKTSTLVALIFLMFFLYYEKCYITYSYCNETKTSFDGFVTYFLSEGLVQVIYIPITFIITASQITKDYYGNPAFAIRYKSRYKLSESYISKASALAFSFVVYINIMLIVISLSAGFNISFSKEYVFINLLTLCSGLLYMLLYYAVYVVTSSTGTSMIICGILYIIQALVWKGSLYSIKGLVPFYNIIASEYVSTYGKTIYWVLIITVLIILIFTFSSNDLGINYAPRIILKELTAKRNYTTPIPELIIVSFFIINTNYILFKNIYHNDNTLSFIVFRGFAPGNVRDMIINLLLILPILIYLINYIIEHIFTLSIYYYIKSGSILKLVVKMALQGTVYSFIYYIILYIMCILFTRYFKGIGKESIYDTITKSSSIMIIIAEYTVITFTLAITAVLLYIIISRIDIAIIILLVTYLLSSNIAGVVDNVAILIPFVQNNYSISTVLNNSLLSIFISVIYLGTILLVFYRIIYTLQEKIISFNN